MFGCNILPNKICQFTCVPSLAVSKTFEFVNRRKKTYTVHHNMKVCCTMSYNNSANFTSHQECYPKKTYSPVNIIPHSSQLGSSGQS